MKKATSAVVKTKQKRWDVIRRKDKSGYDPDPPRCATCIHKRTERIGPKNQPQQILMYCRPGNYSVKSHAICDNWKGKDGSTLE